MTTTTTPTPTPTSTSTAAAAAAAAATSVSTPPVERHNWFAKLIGKRNVIYSPTPTQNYGWYIALHGEPHITMTSSKRQYNEAIAAFRNEMRTAKTNGIISAMGPHIGIGPFAKEPAWNVDTWKWEIVSFDGEKFIACYIRRTMTFEDLGVVLRFMSEFDTAKAMRANKAAVRLYLDTCYMKSLAVLMGKNAAQPASGVSSFATSFASY